MSLGRYDGRITEGTYTHVTSHEHTLYACLFGSMSRAKIQVYDETMPWVLLRTFRTEDDLLMEEIVVTATRRMRNNNASRRTKKSLEINATKMAHESIGLIAEMPGFSLSKQLSWSRNFVQPDSRFHYAPSHEMMEMSRL